MVNWRLTSLGGRGSVRAEKMNWQKFYANLIETLVNVNGEKSLADLLHQPPPINIEKFAENQRFFERVGILPATANVDEEKIIALIETLATEMNRTPAQIAAVINAFSARDFSATTICGSKPQCKICRLTRLCDFYNAPPAPKKTSSLVDRLSASENLSPPEYLTLLLGGERVSSKEVTAAQNVLARFGDLRSALRASFNELSGLREVSKSAAIRLSAMNGIFCGLSKSTKTQSTPMNSAADFYEFYRARFYGLAKEIFLVVLLDNKHNIIRDEEVVHGNVAGMMLKTGEVLAPAIRDSAAAVAFIHNHPSGDCAPSNADITTTKNLCNAAKILDLEVLDHIIIGDNQFFSFAEKRML